MKHHLSIPSCLLLLSLPTLTLVTPTPSLAKPTAPTSCQLESEVEEGYSPEQLKTIAERITVRVRGDSNGASGTLIAKRGNSYLVLTNHHVTRRIRPTNINIQTIDGKIHQGRILDKFNLVNQQEFAKYDLAILEFTASENYCLPIDVAKNNQIPEQIKVLATGYSAQTGRITFAEGQIKKIVTEPAFAQGYEIGYDSKIEQGMSGGPIISIQGELLGINAKYAFPVLDIGYVYIDGTKPNAREIQEFRKLSWGIPITPILSQIKGGFLKAYELPLPKTASTVVTQPLPPWIAKTEEKARQFTVRIDDNKSNNGSGVIIAKEGNTYTILTAAHVLCEKASNNRCIEQEYSILTGDNKKHPIDRNSIKIEEGVDLAVVKFTSNENYPIATLADYPTQDHQYILTAGYPKLGENKSPWRFTLGEIFSKEQGLLQTQSSDFKSGGSGLQASSVSLTGGYELVYTNITLGGMSGGPVLDTQGRVIGIHGRADGQVAIDEKTGDIGPNNGQVQLGYSLGVPIGTFLGIAPRLNSQAQQIEKTTARELQSGEIDSIKQTLLSVDITEGSTTASNFIERGNQLWRLGRYREAITAFDNAIQQKPAFIHLAYYGKGLALLGSGKPEAAAIALEQAVKAKSNFVLAWSSLSTANRGLGKFSEALLAINQAIQLQPDNSNLYNQKSVVLFNLKRYQEAIDAIDQAIKLSPRTAFYNNRGLARSDLGDNQGAIDDFNQAIKLNPNYADAYNNRGNARSDLGDNQGAIDDFQKAADLYQKQGNKDGYRNALKSQSIAYCDKADEQYSRGDKQGAIDDYNQAIKLDPNYAYAYYNRGNARSDLGDKQGAIDDYNQAIKLDPNFAYAYTGRGAARSDLGDKQGAIDDYNQALKLDPNYAYAYNNRGAARSDLGDNQGAIDDYNQAIKLDPKLPIAYSPRAAARYNLGDYRGAINDFNQAIKLDPKYAANAYAGRGLARYKLQDKKGAINDLQKAADLYQNQGKEDFYRNALNRIREIKRKP